MDITPTRIFPLGDNALTVEFGNEISVALNDAAISLANYFTEHPFPGFVEVVPAIASTTIFYKPNEVSPCKEKNASAFDTVKKSVLKALADIRPAKPDGGRIISISVSFRPADALDLKQIAIHSGLGEDEVIDVFLSSTYRVFMLGFLPGFAYMGLVDERIAMPRHAAPRLSVPKGSVGIAGRQTGIYPSASPGGWQIIGRTEMELFYPADDPPCLFAPGDSVQFKRADI